MYEKGQLLASGKTKEVYGVVENPNLVILKNMDSITKFDDADLTVDLPGKGALATTTTCEVFRLLAEVNLPVAFIKQLDETSFLAPKCRMIPLEVICRRFAVGSILKRCPEFITQGRAGSRQPYRFGYLPVEFFLKTTAGQLVTSDGRVLVSGLNPKAGEEDPLIRQVEESVWNLRHPQKYLGDKDSLLNMTVLAIDVLGEGAADKVEEIKWITNQVFTTLETAWHRLGYTLVDFKLEFGITEDGQLLVADVLDCDSWRLRNSGGVDYSKQSFRDGQQLEDILEKYQLIAELSMSLSLN